MLYQKMLMGNSPYMVFCSKSKQSKPFELHKHPEFEFHYCLSGSFNIIINKQQYTLNEGDLVVIPPMTAHEMPDNSSNNYQALVIVVGPIFLSSYFKLLAQRLPEISLFNLKSIGQTQLCQIFDELAELKSNPMGFSDLFIKGNIFKVCALLLNLFTESNYSVYSPNELRAISSIEKALEIIYSNYRKNLTLDEVAYMCGYNKGHFCKIFKNATGQTFHNFLNDYRINIACILLKETFDSIEEIAIQVGFIDSKSFCRVFKQSIGTTPRSYRNNN